jgi:hypothetical protein
MTTYALKNTNGTVLRYQDFAEPPPVLAPEKGMQWAQEDRPVPPPHVPTTDEFIQMVKNATQDRLDTFAQTRNYDGILSACTYATSTVPKFQSEGQYCVNARDNTWASLYTIMEEVQTGTRPMPTSVEEVMSLLPVLTWPAI